MYRLVEVFTREGIAVVTPSRVHGASPQAFYRWRNRRYSDGKLDNTHPINVVVDLRADHPELVYRLLHGELATARHRSGANLVKETRQLIQLHRFCRPSQIWSVFARLKGLSHKTEPPVNDDFVIPHLAADTTDAVSATDITEHWTDEVKL